MIGKSQNQSAAALLADLRALWGWSDPADIAATAELAAQEIERLRAAIRQHAKKQRHTSLVTPADIELYEAAEI